MGRGMWLSSRNVDTTGSFLLVKILKGTSDLAKVNILGKGGFATVYKSQLTVSAALVLALPQSTTVAVKVNSV